VDEQILLQILSKVDALCSSQERIERRLGLLGDRREAARVIAEDRAERAQRVERGERYAQRLLNQTGDKQ